MIIVIDDQHIKFAKLIQDIVDIHETKIKCSVQMNFAGVEDNVSLRYTNIETEDFKKLITKRMQNGENKRTETQT